MTVANFCDILALVRKAPRTDLDLADLTGLQRPTVKRFLDELRAEGHVRIAEWRPGKRGMPLAVYAWQQTLYELPDLVYEPKFIKNPKRVVGAV